MTLEDFYNTKGVPMSDRMLFEKNIILIIPKKDTDISGFLSRAGLDRHEVGVTWPKDGIDLLQEVSVVDPKLVIQVGKRFSQRWPLVSGDGDWDARMGERVREALSDAFVGLHHHDEFSIKDGLGTVSQMLQLLKVQRRSFCCITNHGSVGGWVKQYNACKKAGVKSIFGMEAYVNNYRGDDPEKKKANRSANHLIVLAKNKTGFDNIIRIHNDAQINGFYYDPRANWESMSKWGEGVIGTSACMKGELVEALMANNQPKAREIWDFYSGAFDEFYVELQILEFEKQREVNRRLIKFAREVDAPFVLSCDSHYLVPEHAETHDLLMMIRQGKTVLDKQENEDDVWNFDVRNLYYRNAEQMESVFVEGFTEKGGGRCEPVEDDVFTMDVFREAMENTRKIALSVENIKLDDEVKLPRLYDDSQQILRDKINAGFKRRGLNRLRGDLKEVYYDRVRHEFEVITRLGWADYFLVMEHIVEWAIAEFGEFAVGYGRGSAAGSLVSYCLNLTDIDPIEHGLLFERFLDDSRTDPPDIDTDFDPRIRDKVKDHIVEFFGEKNTCSIGTYQTYKTKAVILDVSRALGLDIHEANAVTKKMDSLQSFEDSDGEEEKVDQMSFDDLAEHYPELLEYFMKYPEVLFHAEVLRNQVKNMGKHAGGVIISDLDLTGRIPVLKTGGKIISAWAESGSASELSSVGLVKFDILGLGNLSVISDCIEFVKQTTGKQLRRKDIPLDDRESIRMGSKMDLVGIFQFESPATKPIVEAVDMESLNDVSAITSLLRPGPKDMGMDMEYANRKKGEPYDMPKFMKEALKDTHGVITYQEQAMLISRVLAGFTGAEANKLRKAMGKKIPELMAEMKSKFVNGSKKRVDAGDITEQEVIEVWNLLESFAGYGFNKSVDKDTKVMTLDGVRRIVDVKPGQKVWCFDNGEFIPTDVVAVHDHGVLPAFEITFDDGSKEVCSFDHKFLTELGQIPIREIVHRGLMVYAREEDGSIFLTQVERVKFVGSRQMYDLEVCHPSHNFTLASGLITSNSHAVAYSAITTVELWLKFHYPVEYITSLINNTKQNKKKHGTTMFSHYINYARKRGFVVHTPDINRSEDKFTIENRFDIRFSLGHVRNVASSASHIVSNGPYKNIEDFYHKCTYQSPVKTGANAGKMRTTRPNKKQVISLIEAGAFDRTSAPEGYLVVDRKGVKAIRNGLLGRYFKAKKEKANAPEYSESEWIEKEIDVLGLCLSEDPILNRYKDKIKENGWSTIDDSTTKKKSIVVGKIMSFRQHTSKKGNVMYIVGLSDGIDSMEFFVFQGAMQTFKDHYKVGYVAAIPMKKFEDSETRFFDDNRLGEVLEK